MANSTHTRELQTAQTKDFDFIFVEEEALPHFRAAYRSYPVATATTTNTAASVFDQESLRQFHQEFKSLVLTAAPIEAEPESCDWEAMALASPIEPHEIEWLDWTTPRKSPVTPTPQSALQAAPVPASMPSLTTPQQAIKPVTGPPLGTLPPVEIWVVKMIGVLVALNLLFAGLIVSGTRLSDAGHWLKF